MSNFLKVVGAPFEYNGHFWSDDPTRILTLEDYENSTNLEAFTFDNDVTVFEPSQLLKPIFWELTGYTSWDDVWAKLEKEKANRWACAIYYSQRGYYPVYDGVLHSDVFNPGSNTVEAYRSASRNHITPLEDMYLLERNAVHYIDRETESFVPLFFKNGQQQSGPKHIYIQRFDLHCWRKRNEGDSEGENLIEGVEIKCDRIINYSADACEHLSGFLGTPKDKGTEMYFGLELEVSTDLSIKELQYIVQHYEPKQEPFFIAKQDGSIDGSRRYAYEIVTVPMTPARMRKEFKTLFGKLNTLCKQHGKVLSDVFYSSSRNGLHIHISKKAFEGDLRELRKAGQSWGSKFLAAFNSDFMGEVKLLTTLSKRDDYTKNQYCGIVDSPVRGRRVAYRVGVQHLRLYNTKYSPAHGNKSKTYEVRLFAGLVELQHILCSIDLVEAMYYYTGCHGAPLCVRFADTFKKWLATQTGFTALKTEILKK